ncbi:class I SAM-dependent methyltransferase [Clostridium sp. JN-1]|jgi:16S rRNA C1402 N4-methylase RsmH|uniref:tRNA (mnm(5)s(2)U34)-methyltransferase n=1 Tax=Clostridium sp. JN-1 TaxID=2483110 RepID=UPI000F0BACCA|nr:class I SAM-dependent methyltransferase [Clostridium sp. JN-1]
MYKYVTNVSAISHYIIKNFCRKFNTAVDATLGNGHDCDFLSENFNHVYAFDIQSCAVDSYKSKCRNNVTVINDSHENFKNYIHNEVDCIIYNLGFLPGGDKSIVTRENSTIKSLKVALDILKCGGIICICAYPGHSEGLKEAKAVTNFVKDIPKNNYGVLIHSFANRENNPPFLISIEKNYDEVKKCKKN